MDKSEKHLALYLTYFNLRQLVDIKYHSIISVCFPNNDFMNIVSCFSIPYITTLRWLQ